MKNPGGSSDGQNLRLGSIQAFAYRMPPNPIPTPPGHLLLAQHILDERTILLELGRECQTDLRPFSSFFIIFSLSLPFPAKGSHSFQRAGPREGIIVQVDSGTKDTGDVSTGLFF